MCHKQCNWKLTWMTFKILWNTYPSSPNRTCRGVVSFTPFFSRHNNVSVVYLVYGRWSVLDFRKFIKVEKGPNRGGVLTTRRVALDFCRMAEQRVREGCCFFSFSAEQLLFLQLFSLLFFFFFRTAASTGRSSEPPEKDKAGKLLDRETRRSWVREIQRGSRV